MQSLCLPRSVQPAEAPCRPAGRLAGRPAPPPAPGWRRTARTDRKSLSTASCQNVKNEVVDFSPSQSRDLDCMRVLDSLDCCERSQTPGNRCCRRCSMLRLSAALGWMRARPSVNAARTPEKYSHALSQTFNTRAEELSGSLKSSGIRQPQTRLIALNRSRKLEGSLAAVMSSPG